MNCEDHAVVTLPSRLKSIDVIVKHILTGFALDLHEGDLARGHVFGLNVDTFNGPAQLCESNPASARQD
jgi:hypothetical protein